MPPTGTDTGVPPAKTTWPSKCLKVFLIAFLVLCAFLEVHRLFFAGKTVQRVVSPDGTTIAEVRDYDPLTGLDAEQTNIELRYRYSLLRHTVFFGLNYGSTVRITWKDNKSLGVECLKCDTSFRILEKQGNWNDVALNYSIYSPVGNR
jgi:hypothetical protein